MSGGALEDTQRTIERVARESYGRLVAYLSAHTRDVAGAEERVIDAGAEIMQVCAAAGGSLSGEHGIGMEKKDLMPLIFSQDDVKQMLRIKEAFDPHGLCNPGKMFPTAGRCLELFARRGRAVGW